MAPQTWLITGCSSGFGTEFVQQLRALGDNVIATGRDAENKLAHLKGTGASILDLDVTSSEDVITSKMAEAWDLYPGGIDVVVNNAGYILSGAFEELTYILLLSGPPCMRKIGTHTYSLDRQNDLEAVFKTNFHDHSTSPVFYFPRCVPRGMGPFSS